MPSSLATRRANKATTGDLALSILPTRAICSKNLSFTVKTTSEIRDAQRDRIWQIFEENMYELYCASSFGWHPQKKRKEIFSPLSRFVMACDSSDSGIIAYSIFRFEREDRQNVIYCYELQVSQDARRLGLGRLLIQMLSDIGAHWDMTKIMLTALKANHAAMQFYKSTGFITDEMSPDFSKDSEGEIEDECDYSILSRRI